MRLHTHAKYLLYAPAFAHFLTASVIPNTEFSESLNSILKKRTGDPWPYGVIGDSWGSGVAWSYDVLYDFNKDHCIRTKEAHGPQMEADLTWTGDYSSGLRDAACSGSRLVDLAKQNPQMGKVGNPNVVVMTSGGNNCGFGAIVDVCIYHSDPTHNYGSAYADDRDRTGECAQRLDDAQRYIDNQLGTDLSNTLNDILADEHVKNNPDFLLYLTGYAQFFGTDYDDWCNTEAWHVGRFFGGILPSPTPYLSKELRKAFNDRISQVNALYKNIIQRPQYSGKVRFIDLDAGFAGHRFCEPGSTYDDQVNKDTNFDKVYLWNLNFPEPFGDLATINTDGNFTMSEEDVRQLFGGNGVTAWSGSGGDEGNVPENGWRLRPFHPRTSGYTSIKNAILAQLKADGLPKAKPPPNNPSNPPYAAGTCSFHLDEWESCADGSKNLFAQIKLLDNSKAIIGQTTVGRQNPLGDSINDANPLVFKSKLPYPLKVVGEHQGDYVQFEYNGLIWRSRTTSGPATCSNGGWDPRNGPKCGLVGGDINAKNQMDCSFPC